LIQVNAPFGSLGVSLRQIRENDMAQRTEHAPGEAAPAAGVYEQLNIFGRPTGIRITVAHKHSLPGAPHGHTWAVIEEDAAEC
jgi:hypothetical protein